MNVEKLSINDIARCIGADFSGTGFVDEFSTDSREIPKGCLFVALEGERSDGHNYINMALEQGAAYAVAHKKGDYPEGKVLYVKNTRQVLLDIAKQYRDTFDIKVVGVTGSVGKTTTKEFIWAVMSSSFYTLKNYGNKNTEIGLPMTLFQLERTHQAAVLEMGMSALGEIEELTLVAQPDIAVITNIGVSHLEKLGSREHIKQAKLEILAGMKKGTPLIICADCDLLEDYTNPDFEVIKYGIHSKHCDIRAEAIAEYPTYTAFNIVYNHSVYHTRLDTIGTHNILNALAAFAVGVKLGIAPEKCTEALKSFETTGMRQKMVQHKGYTVVEDCYNANPDSMKAALETLGKYPVQGKKIAVLGDMLELGEISHTAHLEVGELVAGLGIDTLFACGKEAKYYAEAAKAHGMTDCLYFLDKFEMARALTKTVKSGDVVWVKASRGMELEDVLCILYDSPT